MENKPDWSTAPDWANWLAMDNDFDWYWYEIKPDYDIENGSWWSKNKSKFASSGINDSLEARPKPEQK